MSQIKNLRRTKWPFDPEFWDWKTLKRNCLVLMGDEAAIVSSIDTLNDTDEQEVEEAKKLREQGFVSARFRNWRAYMQYCVLCDKEFLGHRIVRHAQKHFKDGMFLCPICATSYESKEVLEPHVASHVKQSCKERLAAMKASRNQDCFCPVTNCAKAFKFFRNLMAHVRSHKDDEEAMRFLEIQKQKVVCQYCRRQFVNVQHLNDHLQIHCGTRPYICIQLDCKATFNSNSELLMHRKVHPEFKAKCMFPNCGQIFSEAYLLYDHEAQHYLTYTCSTDNCGRIFYSQEQFLSHQQVHNPYAPANVTTETSSKTQQSNSCKQEKEDTLLARGYPEKSNSNTPTDQTQASTTPCTTPDFVKEPVKVKHSIESMLNRMAETEGTEPDNTEMNENSISTADTLNDGSYQTSHTPNSCLTQSSSGDVPAKPTSPNADKTIQPEVEKTDKSSHPLCEQKTQGKSLEKRLKPFKCDQEECEYAFMTKEALFKHLSKMHDYTQEMIEELKRTPSKLSPYPCQICNKTFTRTTGLRIHYEKVHRLSREEMQRLKISARNRRAFKLNKNDGAISCSTPSISTSQKITPNNAVISDWSLYNIKENITNAGYSSPEKPSSSKNIQNNCETSKKETVQKKLGPKMYELDVYSPYRPYRCVHEGCTAAFTIQQNLILHYRAMHQESLNLCNTEAEGEADNYTDSIEKETEVRCQVKNCSRVFEGITTLVQHYLLLHKFSRDKATSMMASMNIGTFNCDRPELDITFKCEYEGCDRVYSTKSNLLRHLIKKHDFVYDPKINDGRRTKSVGLIPASCNEKENVEKTSKAKTKNIVKSKEGKLPVQWTSFENMNLKSKEEASAMCIKNFVVQYPCMIVGCDATTRAERDIHRHYTLHGLAEKTIEEHRGQLIFCRKYIRTLPKDTIKCEGPSGSSEESDHKNGENHFEEKPVECMDSQSQEDANVKDNLAEIPSSTGTKVKRGRPKKTSQTMPMFPQRMRTLRNRTTVHNWRERLQPGLEGTFLKFLKTSDTAQASKRKLNDGSNCDIPSKRQPTQKHKSAIKLKMKYKLAHRGKDCNILVDFRNPVKLKLVNNVKIVLDNTFSNSADVLLKQLQEMKPLVVIKKLISSWS
uniref:C2H2-type domain-containing protein n=1 Tax=Periophthalmus magnuspinnatus TaxID=409849 RepID=A0A3B4AQV2_9GOBI